MLSHEAVWLVVLVTCNAGWVKVANFYTPPHYDPILAPLSKSYHDLLVLAVDIDAHHVTMPLEDAPYYSLSTDWTYLNDTMYFGRLSVFTQDYAKQDVEHNLLKFQGNMTVGEQDRAIMSLVRNEQDFSGYLCSIGERVRGKKTFVNLCLHNVTEHFHLDTAGIKILVGKSDCSDCPRHKIRPHRRGSSLEFGIPDSGSGTQKWNVTVEYSPHTTLCQFEKELSADDLNIVVMKQNLTVSTMFECVLYSEQLHSNIMEMWTPIIAGLVSVVILCVAVTVFYYKCDRACLRQLIPTPDQDTGAAPYRSFNSSNSPKPEPADNRYIKMRNMSYSTSHSTGHSVHSSRHSQPHYERI